MFLEIAVVLLLTVINGLLAMSELAIVSSRASRLRLIAERGDRGAAAALVLAEEPGRFLASVQIGITLVGILAGAFSGATLGARLGTVLAEAGVSPRFAPSLGVGIVVVAITYLSLIVGELVPKQLALKAPEAVASRVAPGMRLIARIAAPLVWFLDVSGKAVLFALGQSSAPSQQVSDEEVRLVIAEAETSGAIEPEEREMIAGVMRIADRTARGLMTPRHEVEVLDVATAPRDLLRQLHDSHRSRFPVRDGDPDDIIGVVASRDILAPALMQESFDLRSVTQDAPVVLDSGSALDVVAALRRAPGNMALVFDEYGHFEGIITPMDVLEAITGAFADEAGEEPKFVTREDGSLLVAGWMPVDEFAELARIELDPDRDYETVAGLVMTEMGHLPEVGECLDLSGWRIEVVDLDGRRIDKLLVRRLP